MRHTRCEHEGKFMRPVLLLLLAVPIGCSSNVRIGDTEHAPRPKDYPIVDFFAPGATATRPRIPLTPSGLGAPTLLVLGTWTS